MKQTLNWIALATLAMLLTACGFHLRGLGGNVKDLPFKTLYLEASGAQIAGDLQLVFARNPKLALVSDPKGAEATLSVLNENQAKDILTINTSGKISEYQLTYTATFRTVIRGVPVEPDMTVTVRRSMNYSDTAILGKEQEENLIWADARRDAAEQAARRLSYLKLPAAPLAGPQSQQPAHAVAKP